MRTYRSSLHSDPLRMMRGAIRSTFLIAAASVVASCGKGAPGIKTVASSARIDGTIYDVHDTLVAVTVSADGVAGPLLQATVSTKLSGTVTAMLVNEGDAVTAGQALARIDARDLVAKSAQVAASIAEADAVRRDAMAQETRMRALYTDSAATRAQLDAAETGLARATAAVSAAHASADELAALTSYAVVRAPFAGLVTKRFVDPGAFAAPGSPLVSIQDQSQLRIAASATPEAARGLRPGQGIDATVEGRAAHAIIEGIVPAAAGNLYTINALVANPSRAFMSGSTATLSIAAGQRSAFIVPSAAIVRQGDLTGVMLVADGGTALRWVRLGQLLGERNQIVEVTAGLRSGDRVVIPAASAAGRAGN